MESENRPLKEEDLSFNYHSNMCIKIRLKFRTINNLFHKNQLYIILSVNVIIFLTLISIITIERDRLMNIFDDGKLSDFILY